MENIVRANFKMWNDALQTRDPEVVAGLYHEEATFLPTLDGNFRIGREKAKEYFVHFLAKKPFGKILEDEIQKLGEGSYAHSGLYFFEIGPAEERGVAHARFTYIWQKDKNGEWKILHHHSSLVPNK